MGLVHLESGYLEALPVGLELWSTEKQERQALSSRHLNLEDLGPIFYGNWVDRPRPK